VSISTTVFIRKGTMLSPAAWQDAIRRAGFPLTLDPDFDPATFSGFLPARYRERDAGFEYGFAPVDRSELGSGPRATAADGYDECVSFVTHSDMAELVSASISAAVLAATVDGLLWDDESGEGHPGRAALEWARALERDVEGDL
jgi:hypothetical protein